MPEISEESVEEPADFVQENAEGTVPTARVRVDYMNLIPESAWVYSRERDTISYDDWENHTLSWMETTQILEDY